MDFQLTIHEGSKKRRRRVGRGTGSGRGKTSGKGHKGQKSRSGGGNPYRGFEGGQKPLQRRLPKRGFNNIFRVEYEVVNLDKLKSFNDGDNVTVEALKNKGLVKRNAKLVKLLGNGEIDKKLNIELHAASKTAIEKLNKAGGSFKKIEKK